MVTVQAERVLDALGDPTRRLVFKRLRKGTRSVRELADGMDVSRPAVSQHLKVLQEAGLIVGRTEGTRRLYAFDTRGLEALHEWLDGFWDEALLSFKAAAVRSSSFQPARLRPRGRSRAWSARGRRSSSSATRPRSGIRMEIGCSSRAPACTRTASASPVAKPGTCETARVNFVRASRRFRQVDDSIRPVPGATFTEPEVGHQTRLLAVVGTPHGAAEQHHAAVIFPRAQHLACVPRKRCAVEGDEHQTGLGARHQQRRIIQAKPGSVLPPCDVNNGKIPAQTRAGRDESMRGVLVSEQPRLGRSLRHALCESLRGKPWRMPALA